MTIAIVLIIILLTGCGGPSSALSTPSNTSVSPTSAATATAVPPTVTPTRTLVPPTATATNTATATPTLTFTPIPTAIPTATPTALPFAIRGDPRRALAGDPIPQAGAPCGIVDVLDFPLDPPDAEDARGGSDFGSYRSHSGLYHAGEDWGARRGQSSYGTSVYSIGHGMVTYAEPLGWGADIGVIIVRHTFSDGTSVLSFYGHLDPPSVVLQTGECVARGDPVGRIGKPRGSPHLHFEVRRHMPAEPGRGYSPKDPTLSGWLPPSQFIWQYRLSTSPGVQWTQPPTDGRTRGIGRLDENTFLAIRDQRLIGIDVVDGSVRWRQHSSVNAYDALIHPDRSMIYVTSLFGTIEAFRVPRSADGGAIHGTESRLASLWQTRLDVGGFPTLMPLQGGGIVASTRQGMAAVSSTGGLLWRREMAMAVLDWVLLDDQLVVTTPGGDSTTWTVDASGATPWARGIGGRLALTSDGLLAYDGSGIWRLDPSERSFEPWYVMPGGYPGYDDMVALPGGGVLLSHRTVSGGSLLAVNADGTTRWRRSYTRTLWGGKRLLTLDGRVYLVTQSLAANEMSVHEVHPQDAELHRIFVGGSRQPMAADTWAHPVGHGCILVNIGGTGMVSLDAQAAREAVQSPEASLGSKGE